jgi:hypothetical protein
VTRGPAVHRQQASCHRGGKEERGAPRAY